MIRAIPFSTTYWATLVVLWIGLSAPVDLARAEPARDGAGAASSESVVDVRETSAAIAERRAEVAATLEMLERSAEASPAHRAALTRRWHQVESRLVAQAALAARLEAAGQQAAQDPSPRIPSVFALNELLDERASIEARDTRREQILTSARDALTASKDREASSAAERRQAVLALESAASGQRSVARRALELAEVDERLAREDVSLRKLELRLARSTSSSEDAVAELDSAISAMRAALAKGEGVLALDGSELDEHEAALHRAREEAARRLASMELRLSAVQSRVASSASSSPQLIDRIEALRSARDLTSQEVALYDQRIERLGTLREMWGRWDVVLRDRPPADQVAIWETEIVAVRESLRRSELQHGWQLADVDARIDAAERRRKEVDGADELSLALSGDLEALSSLRSLLGAELKSLAADRLLAERVLDEIENPTGGRSVGELIGLSMRQLRDFWRFEITSVDDSPITIGSVLIALLLFVSGLWLSRHGASAIARTFGSRFSLDEGAIQAVEALTFYSLLVVLSVVALRAIHFPLAALTVVGGSLAIGIGFGSQNVMNNFISGLILMLERPVRAHDLVEVDGNHGTIEKIGTRSTQIRSTDGRHIIVPNSFFLENNVVNWTLSDDLLRTKVSVGVIYGSPTRLVERLIRQVVADEPLILPDPEPVIIFDAFGDNSLNFDVYFWIRARTPMGTRKVESGIRFAIDDAFREHDLVIAFPQRDVHLDTASPLEVRVLGDGSDASD